MSANLNSTNAKSVTVKAKWNPTMFAISKMQEMTTAICNNTTTPNASATAITWSHTTDKTKVPRTTLTDTRDNNTYLVSKLADGKCWMSEDLRLRWSSGNTIEGSDGVGGVYNFTTVHTTGVDVSWSSVCGGDCNYGKNNSYTQDYSLYLTNGKQAFYNWNAATARVGTNTSATSINQSICAKGWRLPIGGSSSSVGSFYYLITTTYNIPSNSIGYNKIIATPFEFLPVIGNSTAGRYHSSNKAGDSWQYVLLVSPTTVNPAFDHGTVDTIDDQFRVRCVSI